MTDGLEIRVRYCADCGYLQRTTWMLGEVLTDIQHDVTSVQIEPVGQGIFEWSVNGETVFSKAALGRFPDLDEIKELIYAHLQ